MVTIKCLNDWYEISIIEFVENFDKYIKYCTEVYIYKVDIENNCGTYYSFNFDLDKLKQVLK